MLSDPGALSYLHNVVVINAFINVLFSSFRKDLTSNSCMVIKVFLSNL